MVSTPGFGWWVKSHNPQFPPWLPEYVDPLWLQVPQLRNLGSFSVRKPTYKRQRMTVGGDAQFGGQVCE
jgi:hypothetical protein